MPASNEMLEELLWVDGFSIQSLTSTTTTYISVYNAFQDYERILAIGTMATMTLASTCVVTLLKATNSAGDGATSAGTATFTAATDALFGTAVVEKRTKELGDGYTHVAVRLVTDETKYGGGSLMFGKAKIKPVTQTITTS